MENEKDFQRGKHFFKLFIIAAAIFSAMLVCALLGYSFAKTYDKSKESLETDETPIYVNETLEIPVEETSDGEDLQEETAPIPDKNDYLVIWENDAVKLYLIDKDGEKIFSKNLEISPESLMSEDKTLLKEGIILYSEEELASLLEDYSS